MTGADRISSAVNAPMPENAWQAVGQIVRLALVVLRHPVIFVRGPQS